MWRDTIKEVRIKITEKDLFDFLNTLNNQGKIKRTRLEIFKNMPQEIKEEYKATRNDFVCTDKEQRIYKIKPYKCSTELSDYLSYFSFVI